MYHQSAFPGTAFSGVSHIHECLNCLKLAVLSVYEMPLGYKLPQNLLVILRRMIIQVICD